MIPSKHVAESVPERHEAPDVVELRRLAEACPMMPDNDPYTLKDWYQREDLAERNYPIPPIDAAFIAAASPDVVLGLLDRLAHMAEARDTARAEVERLIAEAGDSGYDRALYIDGDVIRRGLIHAFAYAEGIRREDVPRVSAEARRRWENRADRALTELRLLSAAYAAGQAEAHYAAHGRDIDRALGVTQAGGKS